MAEPRDNQSIGNMVSLTPNALARGGPYSLSYVPPRVGQSGSIVTGGGADWFGPLNPMSPTAPPDVKGRILDFPSGYNLATKPRSYENISFEQLRAFADSYDLLRLLIETRKDQMSRMRWNIVPKDLNLRKDGTVVPTDVQARIKKSIEFFERPDKEHFWDEWLHMVLEDLLVIDAATLYRRRTRGGELYGLQQIDGATIKRVIDNFGNTPEPPAPAFQQVLKGYPAVDYFADELIYRPRVKRAHKIYGFSPVEQVVMTINIGMRRQVWQLQSFTEGNIPEALIGTPDTWTPDQVRQFQDWFDGMLVNNTGERRRARFVPGEVAKSYVPTKPDELFGAAEEWLIRVMCFAFSISPQPFVAMMNRATAETAHEAAISEGLVPIQNWVKYLVNTVLIDDFASPDLEFIWLEEEELDPDIKSQIIDREQKAGRLSLNEARKEMGLEPFEDPEADRPMVFIPTAGYQPVLLNEQEKALKDAQHEASLAGAAAAKDGFESPSEKTVPDGADAPEDTAPPKPGSTRSDIPPADKEVAKKSDTPFTVAAGGKTACNHVRKAEWDEDAHPRDEKGRFGVGGGISSSQAEKLNVSSHLVGRVTPEQANELRQAIADKLPQAEVLDKMAPIYQAIPSAGESTLTLDKDGKPPEGFFESREYNVDGDKVGIGQAIDHLTEGAAAFAGPQGVAAEKTATLLLGPSAAGKSTFAEQIAVGTRSAIVDPDEAKKLVEGYNGGLGANEVHEESSQMARMVEARMTSVGANIVIPTVGANHEGIQARVDRLKEAGYTVHLIDTHVGKDEATRRMAERAVRTGRPIGRDYVINVGDKPSRTYDRVKANADGYARINANGPIGTDRVTESHGIGYLSTGKSVLRKSGGGGASLCGPSGRWRVSGPLRSEKGLLEANIRKAVGRGPHYADPLRPFAAKRERVLSLHLKAILAKLGHRAAQQVKQKLDAVAKTDYPDDFDIDALLASVDLELFALVRGEIEDGVSAVYADAGRETVSQFGNTVDAEQLVNKVNDRAVNWARERAAELVSFEGEIDPFLAETTRDMIRADIVNGMEQNLSTFDIADLLEQNYAFSEERAETIASTEITSANSMGALASYEEAADMGISLKKSWLVLDDGCDICQGNADAGAIDLDEEFPSGDMAPGAHPHCRCALVPEVEDDQGNIVEGDAEEGDDG